MALSSFNKALNSVDWGIDSERKFPYKKLSELTPGVKYPMRGCFITPDRGYGLGAVIITDGANINIPNRYVEQIKNICKDAEAVEQIKTGHGAFVMSTFKGQFGNTGYSVDFLDV